MSHSKKTIRAAFRRSVFERDRHRCRACRTVPENGDDGLDAHHITDRNLMPNGGYVKENGIALCATCHEKAEEFHRTGTSHPGYAATNLYELVESDLEKARRASLKLA